MSFDSVNAIVEQHGGRIWVESVVGRGNDFILALPVHEKEEGKPSPPILVSGAGEQAEGTDH